jgi:hypothetical protein
MDHTVFGALGSKDNIMICAKLYIILKINKVKHFWNKQHMTGVGQL